ncbi:MAG: hypothetical protein ACE5OZ_01755 [Candidatus Heimdallarchaeota archaeon]
MKPNQPIISQEESTIDFSNEKKRKSKLMLNTIEERPSQVCLGCGKQQNALRQRQSWRKGKITICCDCLHRYHERELLDMLWENLSGQKDKIHSYFQTKALGKEE